MTKSLVNTQISLLKPVLIFFIAWWEGWFWHPAQGACLETIIYFAKVLVLKTRRLTIFTGFSVVLLFVCMAWFYSVSIPSLEGEIILPGIQKKVAVDFDAFANPTIFADSKIDAYYALGYLTARERMFQMDLMRRKTAGRLSEILGKPTLNLDIINRHQGFGKAVVTILQSLPVDQRRVLQAYADGVNAYLENLTVLPVEFIGLGYSPEPWRIEDSILISLSMFQMLNRNEVTERMISVMKKALPEPVVIFLTPQDDIYNTSVILQGQEVFDDSATRIPVQSLYNVNLNNRNKLALGLVDNLSILAGSNQWAVNKTANGRAILANDMHLPLAVPNLWYQAALKYPDVSITGVTLPGLPLIVAGSNGSIAWGFTNAQADVLDLIELSINPENEQQYKTRQGWQGFQVSAEVIKVKDEKDRIIDVKWTEWGPVSPQRLNDKDVAVQSSIFYPEAVDLALLDMDKTRQIDAAITLFKNAGLPVLNVMLADNKGHIAWTLTGKIPNRVDFDGSISMPRDSGDFAWAGFVAGDSYPDVIDPPSGILVTANNRVLAQQHKFVYGQNFANGYRAFRIAQLLAADDDLTSEKMHAIQLDTRSGFFDFYQQLALSVLSERSVASTPALLNVKTALENWDGLANANSTGFGFLVEFRQKLAELVFSSYVQQCREIDRNFTYTWFEMDTPLRLLLAHQIPETLPGNNAYKTWNTLILNILKQLVEQNEKRFPEISLAELKWGDMQKVQLKHPFSYSYTWLSPLLDMPEQPLSGCVHCVRVATKNFGASMRLVVSPGYEEEMILIEPTGQSGHPLSSNYRDKFYFWVNGLLIKTKKAAEARRLVLLP